VQKTVNYFKGNVQIEIEGAFPERFLNLCSRGKIDFWDMQRPSLETIRVRMRVKDFRRIRKLAQKSMCRVHILEKNGVRFFAWRFRRRYALIFGGLLCVLALLGLSMHIWSIEVVGNSQVPTEKILAVLEENGVSVGTYAPSVDSEMLKHRVLLEIGELSWLTVNIKGSRATVEVRERTPAPEIIPMGTPCNIVAEKAGLIVSVSVLEGAAQTQKGATVAEGQTLVSGIVDNTGVGARFVHAMARVTARTWYDVSASVPLISERKVYTGRQSHRYALVIGDSRINLYFHGGKVYDNCDKIIKTTSLDLFGLFTLPISVVKETSREYTPSEAAVPEAVAQMYASEALEACIAGQIGDGEIVSKQFQPASEGGLLTVRLRCEALEDIARTEEIPASTFAQYW